MDNDGRTLTADGSGSSYQADSRYKLELSYVSGPAKPVSVVAAKVQGINQPRNLMELTRAPTSKYFAYTAETDK